MEIQHTTYHSDNCVEISMCFAKGWIEKVTNAVKPYLKKKLISEIKYKRTYVPSSKPGIWYYDSILLSTPEYISVHQVMDKLERSIS